MAVITAAVVDVGANGQWKASQGTITADKQAWLSTATWNAAVTFTHLKANITDTSSNAASLLMDLQVGGLTKFSVRKDGGITGTLLTAAQPNVTSVGTLTSLTVSGITEISANSTFTSGTGTARIQRTAGSGLVLQAVAGTATDFILVTNAGGTVVSLPTGTSTLSFANGLTVSAGTTAVQALTAAGTVVGSSTARFTGLGLGMAPVYQFDLSQSNAGGGISIRISDTDSAAGTNTEIQFVRNASIVGSITTTLAGVTAYNTSSDARLKDLRPIDNVGAIIDAIEVYDGAFLRDPSQRYPMLAAQQANGVAPWAVVVGGDNPDECPWTMDYSKLVPLMLAEVKSLRSRVSQLES